MSKAKLGPAYLEETLKIRLTLFSDKGGRQHFVGFLPVPLDVIRASEFQDYLNSKFHPAVNFILDVGESIRLAQEYLEQGTDLPASGWFMFTPSGSLTLAQGSSGSSEFGKSDDHRLIFVSFPITTLIA